MTPALYEFVSSLPLAGKVVELGAAPADQQEHMSLRPLITAYVGAEYVGVDLEAGEYVDLVADIAAEKPKAALVAAVEAADTVLCLETLEHTLRFWNVLRLFQRMKPGATLVLSFPHVRFPHHPHPVDCYRFFPDAFPVLMEGFAITAEHVLPDTAGNLTHVLVGVKR